MYIHVYGGPFCELLLCTWLLYIGKLNKGEWVVQEVGGAVFAWGDVRGVGWGGVGSEVGVRKETGGTCFKNHWGLYRNLEISVSSCAARASNTARIECAYNLRQQKK